MPDSHATTTSPLPIPNSTFPFCRSELHYLDESRTTEELPSECDVLITGAGCAGISTAYHLLYDNPSSLTIVILEARQSCSGVTGRNGGHLRPSVSPPKVLQKHRAEAVAEIAIFEMAHVEAIKDLVEKDHIDCDLVLTRALHVTRDEDMAAGLESLVKTIQSSMSQFGNDWK